MQDQNLILFLFLTLILFACKEETLSPKEVQVGYEYYPLEVGKFLTYQVDSIVFDTVGTEVFVDTSSTLVREAIVDSYEGEQGQEIFAIERSERKGEEEEWEIKDVYATYRTDAQAVRTEENLTFIKMIFPVSRGKNWEGVGFDKGKRVIIAGESIEMFKNWESVVSKVGEPLFLGNFAFDDVTTIEVARDTNAIELRSGFEQYAKGIGLVYRELSILNTQNTFADSVLTWGEKAQEGFLLYQQLIDHN
ncbi:MAG: hypothetical protein AAGG68_05540 [Bacteroidota bacterium]